MSKIPVFILSGFLGSGKTTLLKQLLNKCDQKRVKPAILMNEIGKADMDGEILLQNNQKEIVEKLLDGCICCNQKSEVAGAITKLLRQKPDVIFIELTGVANPEEVVDSLTEPELMESLYLEKVVTVLDGENVLEYNSIFEADKELVRTTRRQIEVADVLVVNKIDLISDSQKEKIKKVIRKQNPASPIFFTTYSEIDVEILLGNVTQVKNRVAVAIGGKQKDNSHHHHHHDEQSHHTHSNTTSFSRINTLTLDVDRPMKSSKVEKFLKRWRPNLLRAKGYLYVKEECYLLQHVMKRTDWEPSNYQGRQYLVLIGIDLNIEEIQQEWEKA
ncbi:CobW family GTP-binding protein [Salipaludibacillus sp. HK11]|uniref:CobW family GTP-binding protein n=1 Tax=Salipaludibacillus sp. HK11 TaxID=3394320 RepID=UPI0039FD70CB